MVNGTPIALDGEEGEKIKACLLSGTIPNQDLINHLLMQAGLVLKPIQQLVKTEMTVSSVSKKCETSQVKCEGSKMVAKGFSVAEEVNLKKLIA